MRFTIRQTAARTGIPPDTLRYYDKEGIVSPKRHQNGYRCYDEKDIAALQNVVVMKYAHFTIAEMKSMEELFARDPSADCSEVVKGILQAKIAGLTRAIDNYRKIVDLMEQLLSMVDGVEPYRGSEEQIDAFIGRIFDDIRSNRNGGI